MRRRNLFPGLMALALAACDSDSPIVGAGAALTDDEAMELATAWDEVGAGVMDGYGGPSQVLLPGAPARAEATLQFTSTHACPAGGATTLQGAREVARDGQGSGSVQFAATRTDAACAFPARRGAGTLTLTTTPRVQLTSRQTWTDGQSGTRTSTQKGSFDWSRDATGDSGSCAVDLAATWNPVIRTYTLNGTFCGRTLSVTRTRGA